MKPLALAFMASALVAAGCSSTPPPPPAGTGVDAGTPDTTDGGPVGAACATDSDCGPGLQCVSNLTGGYCTESCAQASDCPSGAVCGMILGQGACEQSCGSNSDCRGSYICDPVTTGCLPACMQDSDCSGAGAGQYCNTTNGQCTNGCQVDSDCASGMSCDTTMSMCVAETVDAGVDAGQEDGGTPDAGSDAGVPDAGTGTDAGGGSCAGYADPNTAAGCTCYTAGADDAGESCGLNNCYGGYYCDLSTLKCVAPPTTCGTTTDAGPGVDSGPGVDAGSSGACVTCTKTSCGTGEFCDCVDAACTMTTCTVACPSSGTCPNAGWTCQNATAAGSTSTTMYSDCLPASDTCN